MFCIIPGISYQKSATFTKNSTIFVEKLNQIPIKFIKSLNKKYSKIFPVYKLFMCESDKSAIT